MIRIRIAPAHFDFNASAFAWAVLSAAGILLVDFDALRVFRFLGYIEGVRNRVLVGMQAVGCNLNALLQSPSNVAANFVGGCACATFITACGAFARRFDQWW